MRPSKWTAGCVLLHDFLEKGNTLLDKSGYKNNGTVSGAIFSPPLGYFEFDGVDDNIVIQHNDLFNPHNDNFSIAFWFNTTISSTTTVFCKSNGGSPSTNYGWLVSIASGEIRFFTATSSGSWGNNGTFEIKTSNTYNDGNWHSCVISVDRHSNGKVKIYIDGKNVGASRTGNITTVGDINNTLNIVIGKEADGDFPYKGYLKNVCYYDRALTFIDAKNFDKGFIPLDGLVAIWKLDKTINGYTLDLPTRNYWGTVTGCTLHTTHEMLYNARQFDGTDDFIDCGDSDSLDVDNTVTIEAWIKISNSTPAQGVAGKMGGTQSSYYTLIKDDKIGFAITTDGTDTTWQTVWSNLLNLDNRWHHILVTYNSGSVTHYLDGSQIGSGTLSSPIFVGTNTIKIGQRGDSVDWFNGFIAEVIIYNKVLSTNEILAHSRNARFIPVR